MCHYGLNSIFTLKESPNYTLKEEFQHLISIKKIFLQFVVMLKK